jgi:hypothetical protein
LSSTDVRSRNNVLPKPWLRRKLLDIIGKSQSATIAKALHAEGMEVPRFLISEAGALKLQPCCICGPARTCSATFAVCRVDGYYDCGRKWCSDHSRPLGLAPPFVLNGWRCPDCQQQLDADDADEQTEHEDSLPRFSDADLLEMLDIDTQEDEDELDEDEEDEMASRLWDGGMEDEDRMFDDHPDDSDP